MDALQVLTLAQALDKRGESGVPLPTAYASLAAKGADICRGALTLVVGPASAGKSLLIFSMIARMEGVSVLAFLLDTMPLTASGRFASILTGEDYRDIKRSIIGGETRYRLELAKRLPDIRVSFHAPTLEDVQRQVNAYEQRFGLPPDLVVIDNISNQSGMFDNEWATLKAMTLELDTMARDEECAVIAAHHTSDLPSMEPAARDKILGKISQFSRLILSVAFNGKTSEFKVAIVKNSEGETDKLAERPVILWADPARMLISEEKHSVQRVKYDQPPLGGGFGGY
jgi:hypothetical protein